MKKTIMAGVFALILLSGSGVANAQVAVAGSDSASQAASQAGAQAGSSSGGNQMSSSVTMMGGNTPSHVSVTSVPDVTTVTPPPTAPCVITGGTSGSVLGLGLGHTGGHVD